jgi:uncharacterized SAM-binding protein YcdF (DUF218 family)
MSADFLLVLLKAWKLAQPSNLLVMGLIAGSLLLATRWRRFGKLLLVTCGCLVAIVGILPVGASLLIPLENRFPANPPIPEKLAGVIVLGGSVLTNTSVARGQPVINDSAERLTTLTGLEKRLPGARIVFTGGSNRFVRSRTSQADVVRRFLEEQQMDLDRVVFEERSRNTYENALFTRELIKPAPGSCWLLVTSAYHMPRSVGVFRELGWQVLAYPVDFRTTGELEVFKGFNVSGNLVKLDHAVGSWIKLAVYWLTGRSTDLFPAPRDPPCS